MTEVKELIFGTGNKAKIQQVQGALGELVLVKGINEFGIDIQVEEDGKTAQENARKKAVAYANALGRTVFAMDNALYFNDLPDSEQPGLYVRRIGGIERLTDEEMVESYKELVSSHGEQMKGYWEFGVSIAKPDGTSVEDSIISPRLFVAKASDKIVPGYPLESIQIDPETGKYVSEMSDEEQAQFWQRNIGKPLSRFVEANL
jgi:XTP/dITP diphosphohydrolase